MESDKTHDKPEGNTRHSLSKTSSTDFLRLKMSAHKRVDQAQEKLDPTKQSGTRLDKAANLLKKHVDTRANKHPENNSVHQILEDAKNAARAEYQNRPMLNPFTKSDKLNELDKLYQAIPKDLNLASTSHIPTPPIEFASQASSASDATVAHLNTLHRETLRASAVDKGRQEIRKVQERSAIRDTSDTFETRYKTTIRPINAAAVPEDQLNGEERARQRAEQRVVAFVGKHYPNTQLDDFACVETRVALDDFPPCHRAYYNPKANIFISTHNYRDDDAEQMPGIPLNTSEIWHKQGQLVRMPEGGPKEVVILDIENKEAVTTAHLFVEKNTTQTFEKDDDAFVALSGTPTYRSLSYFLAQHHHGQEIVQTEIATSTLGRKNPVDTVEYARCYIGNKDN